MGYPLHEKRNKAEEPKNLLQALLQRALGDGCSFCYRHMPASGSVVFTNLFVQLSDTLMQAMVTAAWANRLTSVVASQFCGDKKANAINVFHPSKFS